MKTSASSRGRSLGFFASASIVLASASLAQAATIIPETWYSATSAGQPVEGGITFTTNDGGAGTVRHVLTYFEPTSLTNVGDSVNVSLTLSTQFTGTPTWGNNLFGFGLYNSSGNQITQDGLGGSRSGVYDNYTGYRVAVRPRTTTTQSPFDGGLRIRSALNNTLGSSGAHAAVDGGGLGGTAGTARTFVSGAEYAISYTITRTDADNLSIAFSVGGLDGYSHTWSVGSTYTTFDTFAITLGNENIFDSITLTNVTIYAIPEPGTAATLAGLGVLGVVASRRRRR